MATQAHPKTNGAKMMYLIKRKPATSREELVAHWFANHMPGVIAWSNKSAAAGNTHAWRYIATLFDADAKGQHPYDGVAQLWYDEPQPTPAVAHGTVPTDSFQERALPYVPWATQEYVIMDGQLPLQPLTLNNPFPCTRSGFFKVTFLVALKAQANADELFDHWLNVHVPNVCATMDAVGGFRYVVSHSLNPQSEPYAGMAELYFPDQEGWNRYRQHISADGMEAWADGAKTMVLRANTEMVGIELAQAT